MAERYGWSLHDVDETDARNLLQLYYRLAMRNDKGQTPTAPEKKMFADQVGWL